MKFQVNDQRSYDIKTELYLVRSSNQGGKDPLTTRIAMHSLHLQTFNYAYTG